MRNPGQAGVDIRTVSEPLTVPQVPDQPQDTATGSATIRIINRSTLTGTTSLGTDQDIYDGSAGRHDGQVHGGAENDLLFGGAGSDNLFGGDGRDVIVGGAGDDFIDGGSGSDTLDGGAGFDTLSFITSLTGAVVDLAQGTAVSAGQDRVQGFERVIGSAFADQISGSAAADTLEGRSGQDTLVGGGGADTLIGGRGNDTLTGGAGADRIVFSIGDGEDVVTDFQAGQDRLVVHGYTAYQDLRQVGADTLVVLSGGDTLLLRGVTASTLTSASFEFHAAPLAEPAQPLAPLPSLPDTRRAVSDVLIQSDEVQQVVAEGLAEGFILTQDMARTLVNGGVYSPSLFNAGLVTVSGAAGANAIRIDSDYGQPHLSWVANLATGRIIVTAEGEGSTAYGYVGSNDDTTNIFNAGLLDVTSSYAATGLSLYQARSVSVVNEGAIAVTGLYAIGVELYGDVSFWNSGTITVAGQTVGRGVTVDNHVDVFVNTGTISVGPGQYGSVGLELGSGQGLSFIYNDGIIEATTAVRATGQASINPYVLDNDHFYNTGELRGDVIFAQGRDELYNTGLITGATTLGEGDDLYDGRGGTQLGGVHGNAGDDMLIGGAGVDQLSGDEGSDLLAGGGGNDVLTGGEGRDTFHFTAGDGRDVIKDFDAAGGEVIRITGYTAYQSIEQVGADVRIVLSSSESILLEGVALSAVTSANLVFGAEGLAAAEPVPDRPVAPAEPMSPGMGEARPLPVMGQDAADTLNGTGGDDVIHGLNGDDRLAGGLGDDDLLGGSGADVFTYTLGDGTDTVHDFTASEGDTIRLNGVLGENAGGFVVQGYLADTRIIFADGGMLTITNATPTQVRAALQLGSPPGFRVQEGSGIADQLDGSDVSDLLRGNDGDDRLRGLGGEDIIEGGAGNDVIEGGRGNDQLSGGSGADVFIVRPGDGNEVVLDFNVAEGDILRLEGFPSFNATFADFRNIIIQAGGQQITLNGINSLADVMGAIRIGPAEPTATPIVGTSAGERIVGTVLAERISGGGGGDVIIGGNGSDIIDGGAGNDTISGDEGNDMMTGGAGADTFLFRPGGRNDIITDFDGAAGDRLRLEGYRDYSVNQVSGGVVISVTQDFTGEQGTIFIQGNYTTRASIADFIVLVPDEVPLPNFEFERYGTDGGDTLIGDDRSEIILGGGGNDRVEGRGGRDLVEGGDGNDTVLGGDGDDLLNGGSGTDVMTGGAGRDWFAFYAGDGRDTITDFNVSEDVIDVGFQLISAITQNGNDCVITLQSGDQLTLTGVQAHTVGAANFVRTLTTPPLVPDPSIGVNRIGSEAADVLIGTDYEDMLDGRGGADSMTGGLGDDRYVADTAADLIFENSDGGHDSVTASTGFYLYANIEDLTLAAGAGNIFGVGNELANVITGNEGQNLLIAGAGKDTVNGGAGNDSLFGQDGTDVLNGDAGIDYLVGGQGADMLNGGADADALYGEDGNDTLIGGTGFFTDILVGGAGNDVLRGDSGLGDYDLMDGGSDNDTYWVDSGDDLTFEAAGGGIDTVHADVRVTNGGVYLYAHVENLVLEGTTAFGVGNELSNILRGNASGNYLLGGAGNDIINGRGGNDVLFGEGGNDTFVFDLASGGDVIGDFQTAGDRIDLSAYSQFTSFAQLQTAFSQVGNDGAIDLGGGNLIVLHGVTMANLTAAHFILPGQPAAASGGEGKSDLSEGPLILPGIVDDSFLLETSKGGTADGTAPWVLPGRVEVSSTVKADADAPLVLPGVADDGFLLGGGKGHGSADPWVLPGVAPEVMTGKVSLDGPLVLPGAQDDTLVDLVATLDGETVGGRFGLTGTGLDHRMAQPDLGHEGLVLHTSHDLWA